MSFEIPSELRYAHRVFRLVRPISLRVAFVDGFWVHEYPALSLRAYAKTRAKSLESFYMDFAMNWDEIAQEADDNLTKDAAQVKAEYLRTVESVQTLA